MLYCNLVNFNGISFQFSEGCVINFGAVQVPAGHLLYFTRTFAQL
jgi:hypothetical protein